MNDTISIFIFYFIVFGAAIYSYYLARKEQRNLKNYRDFSMDRNKNISIRETQITKYYFMSIISFLTGMSCLVISLYRLFN
jgi:hypothetical protein